MGECMSYPKNPIDFIKGYAFKDKKGIYTNESELVPLFRVKQMIDHYINNNGWIPVSERLPEEGVYVLIHIKALGEIDNMHKDSMTVNFVKNGEFINCHGKGYAIVAWQPLPEPYKEGDKNE
ncbi:MAG: DUF551 domain-containing protein [Eubacterium sp.]